MRSVPLAGLLLTAAALSLGCNGDPTQPAHTSGSPSLLVTANEKTREFSSFAFNLCTDEDIPITITEHTLIAVTEDNAGNLHVKFHSNASFTGTSELTGFEYTGHQTLDEEFTAKAGEEHTHTAGGVFTLSGHGSVPNEVLIANVHITVQPDGTVTSFHDNFRLVCQ